MIPSRKEFTPREWHLIQKLTTPRRVQLWLNAMPYNSELRGETLRALRVPTLLVTGERSVALFHRLADRLAELLPRVHRVGIAGATHAMHEDHPAAFKRAVLEFLGAGT